jgi:2-keto-3-deoxy-galactonokinase
MTRPDPALAELQRAMSTATGETLDSIAQTSGAIAEVEAQHARDEADRAFGAAIREALTDAHGPEVARAVVHAFTRPTLPSTEARKQQDRIHGLITARLDKICAEVRS